jgi:hypothetical protein
MRKIKVVLAFSLLYFFAIPTIYANDASDILLTCTSINKDLNETDIWLLNIENQTIERSDPLLDDTLGQFQIIKSDDKSLKIEARSCWIKIHCVRVLLFFQSMNTIK